MCPILTKHTGCHNMILLQKHIDWNTDKNEILKLERGVSFEDIISAISDGGLIKIIDHPNPVKYPNQKVMIINIDNYAYVIPFTESGDKLFLKTIYPSHNATKLYIVNKK